MPDLPYVQVTLSVVPRLEDSIIDWLLEREGDTGFTSVHAHGHGTLHELVTKSEQVSGRQRRLQFQVILEHDRLNGFLDGLAKEFSGADIRYWYHPVSATANLASG